MESVDPIKFIQECVKIIKYNIKNFVPESHLKRDKSLVTNIDINIENDLISLFKKNCSEEHIIITEENHPNFNNNIELNSDYLILDPIDGTENFYFFGLMYGVALSARMGSIEIHFIYLPWCDKIISNHHNLYTPKTSNLMFSSTGSVPGLISSDMRLADLRVVGSSSFTFYLTYVGGAKSYIYTSPCKIWDYYTGLSLAEYFGYNVKMTNLNWKKRPNGKDTFEIEKSR